MSERTVESPKGSEPTLSEEDIRKSMSKEEKRARAIRILERGIIVDRTTVENLPPHLHGEWVSRDQMDIERKKALGFWIDKEYATKRSLHSDGTDSSVVGDTVFMVCLKEDKEIIDQVRYEQYIKMHGSPAEKKNLGVREENEFRTQAEALGLPVIEESTKTQVRKDELIAALSQQEASDSKK